MAICGGPLDPANVTLCSESFNTVFRPPTPETWTLAYFTDPGLVDRSISLGEVVEPILDKNPCRLLEELRRGFWQDYGDACYLAYILKAFRLAAEQGLVQAVVHGGDSVQIGVRPEFETYVEIVGKSLVAGTGQDWAKHWTGTWFQTPLAGTRGGNAMFYQILGNHEVLFLGTFNGSRPIRVPSDAVSNASSFARLAASLPPWRERTKVGNTNAAIGDGTFRRGYFSACHTLPDGKRVLLVMLNTRQGKVRDLQVSTPHEVSFQPSMGSDQLEWLNATLKSAETDPSVGPVLVFGHHPLGEVALSMDQEESIGQLPRRLTSFSKVKAYFCGHLHSGCPPVVHSGKYPVIEYVVPSLMEFPKCFALIRVNLREGTSDYQVSVQYHNLTELIPFPSLRELERPNVLSCGNQARLEGYLARLDRLTSCPAERMQLAAIACYQSAERDLAHNQSRRFPQTFRHKAAADLRQTYREAQQAWELLKERAKARRWEDPRTSWVQTASVLQGAMPETALATLALASTNPLAHAGPTEFQKFPEFRRQPKLSTPESGALALRRN